MSPRTKNRLHRLKTNLHPKHEKGSLFFKRLIILGVAVAIGFIVGRWMEMKAAGVTATVLSARMIELLGEAGVDVFID